MRLTNSPQDMWAMPATIRTSSDTREASHSPNKQLRYHLDSPVMQAPPSPAMFPNQSPSDLSPVVTTTGWTSPTTVAHLGVDLTSLKSKELFPQRKQREFIPDNKKDDSYWDRRRRNNEAAKRSREKRRLNDMVLQSRLIELAKENAMLKAELVALKEKYGMSGQCLVDSDQIAIPITDSAVRKSKIVSTRAALSAYYRGSQQSFSSGQSSGDQEVVVSRRQPTDCGVIATSCLPHKLRHKSHLSEKSDSGYSNNSAREDVSATSDGDSSVLSNDTPSPGSSGSSGDSDRSPHCERRKPSRPDLRNENFHLRSQLQQLASEVASLKTMLMHQSSNGGSNTTTNTTTTKTTTAAANNNNTHEQNQSKT
ncbi:LOW QUALITY PROTEIN: nuclear factor interleukin-3-regulated protein-like [Centruroides vittatus]|uniref:LOW QUALITY PROTEIN: nuclear factor interleukin-3-regulated protein-like n=1 Tax=Centruroides vittatus TaxID=120091 RepID=UPI00350F2CC7